MPSVPTSTEPAVGLMTTRSVACAFDQPIKTSVSERRKRRILFSQARPARCNILMFIESLIAVKLFSFFSGLRSSLTCGKYSTAVHLLFHTYSNIHLKCMFRKQVHRLMQIHPLRRLKVSGKK